MQHMRHRHLKPSRPRPIAFAPARPAAAIPSAAKHPFRAEAEGLVYLVFPPQSSALKRASAGCGFRTP